MALKTRYLQLSDTTMFEYTMNGESGAGASPEGSSKVCVFELVDGHYVTFYPISCECEPYVPSGGYQEMYKKRMHPLTLNTLNHLCVPDDESASMWYHFLDADYAYVDNFVYEDYDDRNPKFAEYLKRSVSMNTYSDVDGVRWDAMKLYFVNGYDFSNIYALQARISVNSESGKLVDLCDFFVTGKEALGLMSFTPSPIIMGNNIYDRFIEVKLPCLYDLIRLKGDASRSPLIDQLNIDENTTIKLAFSVILEDDVTLSETEYNIFDIVEGNVLVKDVNLTYSRSSVLKGTVINENISSDSLGCYIAETPDMPYIEFYATWDDEPLSKEIVWRFNKGIKLYDTSYVRRLDAENSVPQDYVAEHTERKWMAMHEIKCTFCEDSTVLKEETYSMNQIFVSDSDPVKFYYRPVIFDESLGVRVNNIQVVYTMRFINTVDNVQFVKVASLALLGNMGKYYAKSTNLGITNLTPYKVFNKIVENKQSVATESGGGVKIKYVKVYYDSSSIVLDENGGTLYGSYGYNLNMSQAPKNYKFTFKRYGNDGKYTYADLTGGYYKLMFKDSGDNTVLIDPTYSKNMNLYLGEIEFNVSSANVNRLSLVEESKRKMSILSYGEDGTVSSMFDFTYSI